MRPTLLFLILLIMISSCGRKGNVGPGELGIIVDTDTEKAHDTVLEPGFHSIPYGSELVIFDGMVRSDSFSLDLLSSDGYELHVEGGYRYSPVEEEIPELYNEIGKAYHERAVVPELRSAFREPVGERRISSIDRPFIDTLRKRVRDSLAATLRSLHIRLGILFIEKYEKPSPEERRVVKGGYGHGVAYQMTYLGDRAKEDRAWSFLIGAPSSGGPEMDKGSLESFAKEVLLERIQAVVEDESVIISLRDAIEKGDMQLEEGSVLRIRTSNKAFDRIELEARRSGPYFISVHLLHTDTSNVNSSVKDPKAHES